jgi:hypothetical protein
MSSTAERITEAKALIARLEGDLAASRAVEEQSRSERAEHALAAAEGSASAQKALSEASHAAAMAVLDSENLELAISSARDRLAGFQAQAAQERLAVVQARVLELARERQTLGPQLQQALTALNVLFVAWRGAPGTGGSICRTAATRPAPSCPPSPTICGRLSASSTPGSIRPTAAELPRPILRPPSCAMPASWHRCRPSRPASPSRCWTS